MRSYPKVPTFRFTTHWLGMQMKAGGNLLNHIAELKTKFVRLESMGEIVSEGQRVVKLSCSLPKEYNQEDIALRVHAADLDWDTAVSTLQSEHDAQKGSKTDSENSSALVADGKNINKMGTCFKRGKTGHCKAVCKSKTEVTSENEAEHEYDKSEGTNKKGSVKRWSIYSTRARMTAQQICGLTQK